MSVTSIVEWYSNSGLFAKCAPWSRTYKTVMPKGHHMRIGRFACVATYNGQLIVAQVYDEQRDPKAVIARTSKHWDSSKRDRLSQCDRVEHDLQPSHRYYKALTDDIAAERAYHC